MSSNDELSASIFSSSDDEPLESMREAEGSFNSIVQPYQDEPIADRHARRRRDWGRRRGR